MRAIFLDIDGVLNGMIAPGPMHPSSTLPECVENINEIIDATGSGVIVISSWVDDFYFVGNNAKLEKFLYDRGVREGSIIGFRAEGATKEESVMKNVQSMQELESFVIIDDNFDVITNPYLRTRHIQPNSLNGIAKLDVELAIKMLQE